MCRRLLCRHVVRLSSSNITDDEGEDGQTVLYMWRTWYITLLSCHGGVTKRGLSVSPRARNKYVSSGPNVRGTVQSVLFLTA